MFIFKGKTLLFTGGTDSFENAVLNKFLDIAIEMTKDNELGNPVLDYIEENVSTK